MQSFLGSLLEVEQLDCCIKLHLDTYIQELIAEYQLIRPKFLKQKKVPMSPGLVLDTNDCPETPYPVVPRRTETVLLNMGKVSICCALDPIFRMLQHSWRGFVHLRDHCTGQR